MFKNIFLDLKMYKAISKKIFVGLQVDNKSNININLQKKEK